MRKPIAANQFYEGNFSHLDKQIESCFYHKQGPADLPVKRTDKKLIAIISPHAGYDFSGPCQSWAYKEIAESKFPKSFLIVGPDHSSAEEFSITSEDFEMPFGTLKVDKTLFIELKSLGFIKDNPNAHLNEHSIEVQLPFLQYANKDNISKIRIMPLLANSLDLEKIRKIAEVISKFDVVSIASSDFVHYGSNYQYEPFKFNIKDNLHNLDKKAIAYILNLDSESFIQFLKETKATICGYSAILIIMEIAKLKKAKAHLLQYYTSGDLNNNYKNSVGYASIAFY